MDRLRVIRVLVLTAILSAACGGGGDHGGGTTIPPGPGTDPVLAAKAKAATMQTADFGPASGFSAQPDEPGQGLNVDLVWQELTRCLGVENDVPPAGMATSPTFLRGLATQGRSTVEYSTQHVADGIAAALAGPKATECLSTGFAADVNRSKPEGSRPGPVKVASRAIAPVGPRVFSWRINASVLLDDLEVPLFQDYIVIFDRGTIIRFLFLNPGGDFPVDLERSVIEKIVARAA